LAIGTQQRRSWIWKRDHERRRHHAFLGDATRADDAVSLAATRRSFFLRADSSLESRPRLFGQRPTEIRWNPARVCRMRGFRDFVAAAGGCSSTRGATKSRRRSCSRHCFSTTKISLIRRAGVKARMRAPLIVEQGLRTPTGPPAGRFSIGFILVRTGCWPSCRSASSSSLARAFRTIWRQSPPDGHPRLSVRQGRRVSAAAYFAKTSFAANSPLSAAGKPA
jgi:hypothetical protein